MDPDRHRHHERALWSSLGIEPTERFVELPRAGGTIRLLEIGEGAPAVFVHGASTSASSWAPLVPHLDGVRCILVDRPGCGLSPARPTRFDVAGFAAFADGFVADVLDAVGLEQASVVATSYGGLIALRSAAAHPDRVGRLVLFGWTFGAPTRHLPLVMRVASVPAFGRVGTAMPVSKRMVRALLKQIGLRDAAPTMSDEAIAWFQSILRDTDTMRNELRAGPRAITLRGLNPDLRITEALLASVRAPTRFVWGESDPFGAAAEASAFVPLLAGAELELVPGGHAVWMDDAARAGASARSFLVG